MALNLEQAAQRVASSAKDEHTQEVFIDPITISLICSILSAIFSGLRLWCEWRRGQKADGDAIKETCCRQPLWVRRRVHRIARDRMSREEYIRHGNELVNAIFEAGANASPEELAELVDNNGYVNRFGEFEQEL